jgi:hypothetical protein
MRLKTAPGKLANFLFGTLWYDHYLARRKRVFQGALPDSSRYVIYLMFPRNGLLVSHLKALAAFGERGYTPVVISNLPLSEDDRKRLLEGVGWLIERPNYGYDFGGYRDGILFIKDRLAQLDRLVLMNDSVWFPVPESRDWLGHAERMQADVVGAVANYFSDPGAAAPGEWRYDSSHPQFHYCSFALSFGQAVLRNKAFLGFWSGLRLSNDKVTTVLRGEVGLGQWIVRSGHSHRATLDISRLDEDLDCLNDGRVREVAENLIIPEDASLRGKKARLLSQHGGAMASRQDLKNFILKATAETGAAYALLDFSLNEKSFCFIKKSPLWLNEEDAKTTLKLISKLNDRDLLLEAGSLAAGMVTVAVLPAVPVDGPNPS